MTELTPEQVAAALERVYARAEFTERTLPAVLRWLVDAWAAIKLWIALLLQSLLELEGSRPIVFWIIMAWLIAALVFALAHIGYSLSLAFRGRAQSTPRTGSAVDTTTEVDENDPAVWEERSRAAAAAGRLRDAALALYHAVILRLDAHGAVRFRVGKTPGEYRREARATGDLGQTFDAFLRVFHPLAFGPRTPDPQAWESLRDAATAVGAHA